MEQKTNIRKLVLIAMLAALSAALMLFHVPLPFAPAFLEFDVAELPVLFAGFFLGPISGTLVVVIKVGLKLLQQGTTTVFVGELSNIFHSLTFMLPAAYVYKRNRSKTGAVLGMVVGTLVASILAVCSNAWVMFPLYAKLYSLPVEAIVEMAAAVNPLVKDEMSLMLFSILPFNLVKFSVTSILTYLIYKRAGTVLRRLLHGR